MRRIPATMATQHPDNASAAFWDDGDGFIAAHEEAEECLVCYRDIGTSEFMWDWEGKYADESVIEKLFSHHFDFFKKRRLGKDIFLTFRLPNVWQEKGYSLIRALMVILTSEDLVQDLKIRERPLFEVILPMTERAEQLMYIQHAFQRLARFKSKIFHHRENHNDDHIEMIPLVEGVEHQIRVGELLEKYVALHTKVFGKKPRYVRPFLARSDPALVSGLVANVLANKVALADIYAFGKKRGVGVYPIIGAGSLVFRGGLSPSRVRQFVEEYAGVRTVTIQSAFRYDYRLRAVKSAVRFLERSLPHGEPPRIKATERKVLVRVLEKFATSYRETLTTLIKDLDPVFKAVPRRRERRQHIGLLAYGRSLGKKALPRAISFTAALYSIGVPPEFVGLGRTFAALAKEEKNLVLKHYRYLKRDLLDAGRFINHENITALARKNPAWQQVERDILLMESALGVRFGPKTTDELLHCNLSSQLLLRRRNEKEVSKLIVETGKLRCSLG